MPHLTESQRYVISSLLKQGKRQSEIAKVIDKDKSVISREIKRNSDGRSGEYRDDLANKKYHHRQEVKKKNKRFTPSIQASVEELLKEDYSPEQIVGTLKKQEKDTVSIERIYQHVWEDKKKKGDLFIHLRSNGKRYRKRGNYKNTRGIIQNRISIEKRPKMVERKTRFGDFEIDLIIGKNHEQAIVTANDRASGILKMRKVMSKNSEEVTRITTDMLQDWTPYIKTITSDNGKEFAEHEEIAENLQLDYYFAHPYHSWERGANENLNGLIRQYFKKGSDFTLITDEQIQAVENKLNNRPRKRYKYENPIFVMNKLLFNQKVAFIT